MTHLEFPNAAGKLKEFTLMNDMDEPVYELIECVGPPHSRTFSMKCSFLEHVAQGKMTKTDLFQILN